MPSFTLHPLLPSLRVRVTSLHQHGDRFYVGTATGTVQVYSFKVPENGEGSSHRPPVPNVELIKTYTLGRKPIDQVGVLAESRQVVVLSDAVITSYDLNFTKSSASPLAQAKSAHCFAMTSFTPTPNLSKKKSAPSLKSARSGGEPAADVTKVRDLLVVGCRKKVLVYGAGKGGLKDPWELSLPHSPRHMVIPSQTVPKTPRSSLPESVHMLYSPQASALLHIAPSSSQRLSVSELPALPTFSSPNATSDQGHSQEASGGGLTGALTGLGGYVGLGGKTAGPVGAALEGNEALIGRDEQGVFFSSEGSFSRTRTLQWSTPPDYIAFSNPFIYSACISDASATVTPSPVIAIHLSPSLAHRTDIPLPPPSSGSSTFSAAAVTDLSAQKGLRVAAAAPRLVVATTPSDKSLITAEGSSVSVLLAGGTEQQIDDLSREGLLQDAVDLVEAIGEDYLAEAYRLPRLQTLRAVQRFAEGEYQAAIETFLRFDISPALVLSLYPSEAISGRLAVPKEDWLRLFGAVEGAKLQPAGTALGSAERSKPGRARTRDFSGVSQISKKGSMESMRKGIEDGKSSNTNGTSGPVMTETELPRAALEALMYYLSDRRQKVTGAMSALPESDPLPAEISLPPLSSLSANDLHALPSIPLTELDSTKLLRVAQIIYTALIKVYLVARPVLVGSLCRIENWCDVEEVEELLKAKEKYGDLIDLYQGKKMHGKALKMLHELALKEDDKLDRYPPTIRYLQKLGPTELPLILEYSEWMFKEDSGMALQVFTADEPEVEALPRKEVTDFLDRVDQAACMGYLEHIINTLGEEGSDFHDRLAELYFAVARADLKKAHEVSDQPKTYSRLLSFLEVSRGIRPYRLLNKLSGDEMPEARAILLGKMGNHDEALRIYVYRLHDYTAAETYCSKIYSAEPDPHGIYLTLLNIYLRPSKTETEILLEPAIQLIASNGPRIEPQAVLDLLPPLVTMEDVRLFFVRTLRDGHAKKNERRVVKNLASARKEEVERVLMDMQMKRVRIRDQRICPQCQKRLGGSAIAVHAPRGEVTHLHCKDTFSSKLARLRDT